MFSTVKERERKKNKKHNDNKIIQIIRHEIRWNFPATKKKIQRIFYY